MVLFVLFRVSVRMAMVVSFYCSAMLSFRLLVAVRVVVACVRVATVVLQAMRVTRHRPFARAMTSSWPRVIMSMFVPMFMTVLMIMLTNVAMAVIMPLAIVYIRSARGCCI